VAIDSLDDMRRLFAGIPLGEVTTSMTINATAPVLLLLYLLVAEEQGVPAERLGGTVQNDLLKEFIARGTYVYPPGPSMRLVVDTIAWCARHLPRWNPVSVSGYHLREAGATAAQELAFTLSDAIAYLDAAVAAGLDVGVVAPRVSFFFSADNGLLTEVAKFRAARRMWHAVTTGRFGATEGPATRLRFHAQTAGSALTAHQPEVNVARVALQALAAVLGGAQSLHTNGFDEALGLPSAHAATLALRTQQVIAFESGVPAVADPLGGAYAVESLCEALEAEAWDLIARVDDLGGAVAAVQAGFQAGEIETAAYEAARRVDDGRTVVVGVNRFVDHDAEAPAFEAIPPDPDLATRQAARVRAARASRDGAAVAAALEALGAAARGTANLLDPMKDALRLGATVGEVSDALRAVFGEHRPGR
jgi:methylmalonyl-CoA mutase N-terminal domain/subunit